MDRLLCTGKRCGLWDRVSGTCFIKRKDGDYCDYGWADNYVRDKYINSGPDDHVTDANKLAEEHWSYVESICHKMYVDAFVHGVGHGREMERNESKKTD